MRQFIKYSDTLRIAYLTLDKANPNYSGSYETIHIHHSKRGRMITVKYTSRFNSSYDKERIFYY